MNEPTWTQEEIRDYEKRLEGWRLDQTARLEYALELVNAMMKGRGPEGKVSDPGAEVGFYALLVVDNMMLASVGPAMTKPEKTDAIIARERRFEYTQEDGPGYLYGLIGPLTSSATDKRLTGQSYRIDVYPFLDGTEPDMIRDRHQALASRVEPLDVIVQPDVRLVEVRHELKPTRVS